MSTDLPEAPTSKDIGAHLEVVVADRLDWDHVGEDQGRHVDAWTPDGAPAEIKGARRRVSDGTGTQRGRWWIQQANHARLCKDRGYYALAVYDLVEGPALSIEHLAVVPARVLESLLPGWTAVPEAHAAETSEATQLAWSRIFGPGGEPP